MRKGTKYITGRANGKSMICLYKAVTGQPSYTIYSEGIRSLGGTPRSWLWFQLNRLRVWWFIKRVEWSIMADERKIAR